jgi:hypothetical protein
VSESTLNLNGGKQGDSALDTEQTASLPVTQSPILFIHSKQMFAFKQSARAKSVLCTGRMQ